MLKKKIFVRFVIKLREQHGEAVSMCKPKMIEPLGLICREKPYAR